MKLQIFTIKIRKLDSNHTCLAVTSFGFCFQER